MADPHATGSRAVVRTHRYSATVSTVRHWNQPPDKRQDVEQVVAHLDYAHGAVWWLEDEGAVKPGDRYMVTMEAR